MAAATTNGTKKPAMIASHGDAAANQKLVPTEVTSNTPNAARSSVTITRPTIRAGVVDPTARSTS